MIKVYSSDSAKAHSREKIIEALRFFFGNELQKPERFKVMCLESPEGLEIKQVYDPLGFLRKHITVVERNEEIAKKIEAENLGVKVIRSTVNEFFKTWKGAPFHVISLDTTGKISADLQVDIDLIARHQLLASPGVLILNTVARRENNERKFLRASCISSDILPRLFSHYDENGNYLEPEIYRKIADLAVRINSNVPLSTYRDNYTSSILRSLTRGVNIFFEFQRFSQYYPNSASFNEKFKNIFEPEFDLSIRIHLENLENMKRHLMQILNIESINEIFLNTIFAFLEQYYYKGYITKKVFRYSYNSNTGTPMHLDIIKLNNAQKELSVVSEIFQVHTVRGRHHLSIENRKKRRRQIDRFFEQIRWFLEKGTLETIPERIFLGSGKQMIPKERKVVDGKMPKEVKQKLNQRDRITKDQAIDFLKLGCSPEEIASCFMGFSTNSLRAIKAHITMGTYQKNKVS